MSDIWHACKHFWTIVCHILVLDTDLSFSLSIFHLSGFLPIFLFMTAHSMWFAEFCSLEIGIMIVHFQCVRNLQFYISFSRGTTETWFHVKILFWLWFLISQPRELKALERHGLKVLMVTLSLSFLHSGSILLFPLQIPSSWRRRSKWIWKNLLFFFNYILYLISIWISPGFQSIWKCLYWFFPVLRTLTFLDSCSSYPFSSNIYHLLGF